MNLLAGLLASLATACLVSLLLGPDCLLWPLPGGMPLGNALAALGLTAASGSGLAAGWQEQGMRRLASVSLLLSLAWFPCSVLLAGNLALSFNGEAGSVWMVGTLLVCAIAVLTLVLALVRLTAEWRAG